MLLSLDCRLEREAGRPPLRRELPLSDGGFGSAKPQPLIGEEERFSAPLGAVSGRPPSKGGVDPGNPLGDFTAGRVAARMSSVLEPEPRPYAECLQRLRAAAVPPAGWSPATKRQP